LSYAPNMHRWRLYLTIKLFQGGHQNDPPNIHRTIPV